MAYPGLAFAILVGVALGTAIYYYFNQENNTYQRGNQYQYHDSTNSEIYVDADIPRQNEQNQQPKRRKRSIGSSNCSICLDYVISGRTLDCGHSFHDNCIRTWLVGHTSCPNCRQNVGS